MLEKTLESPLDSKEIKPVNHKEISPEYSLDGLMLKLKLQYSGLLMWRSDSLAKTLMLGKTKGRRRDDRGQNSWMASLTQWTWVWANFGRWWRTGEPDVLQAMGSQRGRCDSGTEQQRKVFSFQCFKRCCFTSCWPPQFLMGKASHPNCPSPVSDILSLAASKIFFFVYIFSSMVMTCPDRMNSQSQCPDMS